MCKYKYNSKYIGIDEIADYVKTNTIAVCTKVNTMVGWGITKKKLQKQKSLRTNKQEKN